MLVYDIFYLLSSIDFGFSVRCALHNADIRLYACSALSNCIIVDLRTTIEFVIQKRVKFLTIILEGPELMDEKTACGID
jgi:hypothetical protein